ncbi:MAG TPA: hypothetical protein VKH83_14910, partial [Methylomirabilota bacterium]|nr:hypothetical protein [Methylomirabilota bacterium]
PTARPRFAAWLARRDVAALDPEGVETLRAALDADDPPVTTGRGGTLVGYLPGPARRRLVQFDRLGHLVAACRWRSDGALAWAKCQLADGRWLGIETGAATHAAWGASDRVWLMEPDAPWAPREPVTLFQALGYHRPDFIPPLLEPRRLPPGGGTVLLNLIAALMKDQGVANVRYRGPYPTEQLFTALLECFRYDAREALPLERFLADGALDWHPAPFETHHVAPGVVVHLRHEVEKVTLDGVMFYRAQWQEIRRREPHVIRDDGDRLVCSLWALGGSLEDRLVLDRLGEVLDAPAASSDSSAPSPLPPVWRAALGDLIARESAPALASSIADVTASLDLEWGPVPGDLLRVQGQRIRLSRRLREAAEAALTGAASPQERAEQALRFVLEVARLLGPEVRARAQAHLESLGEEEQRRILESAAELPEAVGESVGRLISLVVRGGG